MTAFQYLIKCLYDYRKLGYYYPMERKKLKTIRPLKIKMREEKKTNQYTSNDREDNSNF